MKIQLRKAELEIGFLFAAGVTLMLILDDSGGAAMTLTACLLHECGHLLCLLAFGEAPCRVKLAVFGMRIDRARGIRLSLTQEAAVALAGPCANLLLALCAWLLVLGGKERMLLPVAVNFGIAAFNLLPIEPLDGSKALYFLLCRCREEDGARRFVSRISLCLAVPLVIVGGAVLVKSGYNFTLLAVSVYLFLLILLRKE